MPHSTLNDTRRTREIATVTPPVDRDLAAEATQARPLRHPTSLASMAQVNLPLQAYNISRKQLTPTVPLAYSIRAHRQRCKRQVNTEVQARLMVRARKRIPEQVIAMLKITTHPRSAWPVPTCPAHRHMGSSLSTATTSRHKILMFPGATSTVPSKAAIIHKTHLSPAHQPVNPPRRPTVTKPNPNHTRLHQPQHTVNSPYHTPSPQPTANTHPLNPKPATATPRKPATAPPPNPATRHNPRTPQPTPPSISISNKAKAATTPTRPPRL